MNNYGMVYTSGFVERYHTIFGVDKQKLSQHLWGVATLILHLDPNARIELVKVALLHDCPEAYTGDVPAPTKKVSTQLKHELDVLEVEWWNNAIGPTVVLSDQEKDLLKVCDILEGVMFCALQIAKGSTTAKTMVSRWLTYLQDRYPRWAENPKVIALIIQANHYSEGKTYESQ